MIKDYTILLDGQTKKLEKNMVDRSMSPVAVKSLYWNLVLPFILECNHFKVQSTIVQALPRFFFFFW